MTAPMIVAQWINCQYLFSTIDNEAFGAGDKTTQNVIGGFGVVQGSGGDLCTGLPRQSLFHDDGTPTTSPPPDRDRRGAAATGGRDRAPP
jgi:uncharacterized protein YbcC (UPF0753/DUF2309 family)